MLLTILIASTKTLSVHPRYSLCFPLSHVPGRGAAVATRHASMSAASVMAVHTSSSRRVPLSLTETMHTARELTPTVAQHCSTQAVMPAKCVPLELPVSNCRMWPQHRTAAFSLSLWLLVDTEIELSTASDNALESTTDLDLAPAGHLQHCSYLFTSCNFLRYISTQLSILAVM